MNDVPAHATDPVVARVIDAVLDGTPLRVAVKAQGLTPQLFHYRLSQDKAAAVAYSRAAELKADLLADDIVALADGDGDPGKVRNQIQARQWLASKLHARRYGDRIDLNVTQTVDIGATLQEARARLARPIRDLDVIEGEASAAITGQIASGQRDNQSLPAPPGDAEPDIFS